MKKLLIVAVLILSTALVAAPGRPGFGGGGGGGGMGPGPGGGFFPGPGMSHLRFQALFTARQLVQKYEVVINESNRQINVAYYRGDYRTAQQLQEFGFQVMMQTSRIKRRVIDPLKFGAPNSIVRGNMHRIEIHGNKNASRAWHGVYNKPQRLWNLWSSANQTRKKLHQITEALY